MKSYWNLARTKLILSGLLPFLLGLIVGGQGWVQKQRSAAFVENMRQAEGEVLRITQGMDVSFADVQYTDEAGVPYRKQFEIDSAEERTVRATNKISLVYDSRNPEVASLGHVVSANNEMLFYWALTMAGFLAAAAGMLVVAYRAKELAAIATLFKRGQLVPTEVRDSTLAPGLKIGRFTYAFRGPNGRWYEGKSPELPAEILSAWPPGRKVLVAFNPADPLQSEPDVFGLVEPKRRDELQFA